MTGAAELAAIVGADNVITDPDLRAGYESDWTGRYRGSSMAVVQPGGTEEVARVVAWCADHGVPIVPQGGNTGLVAGAVPQADEIVLTLRRMNRIDDVDAAAQQITAQAGARLSDVQAAAASAGLAYAVDLAARDTATIGGTIATNAGGINVVRYGPTRAQVIGVEAVLGNGDVVSHLNGLTKDNTGYHLPSLLCGSEGTLGIVTAARLALVPGYSHRVTALLAFTSVAAAVEAATVWRRTLPSLEAIELILANGVELVCTTLNLAKPFASGEQAEAYLVIEAADHDDPTDAVAQAVSEAAGVVDVAVAADHERRRALWRYREDHTLAINTIATPHKFDVTVPSSELARFLSHIPDVVTAAVPHAQTWLFGHVGDGNVHVNVTGIEPDDDRVDDAVLTHVAEIGGSISAEHGIGTAKQRWLHLVRTPAEIAAMRAIKRALDPAGIMNPRALLPA